MSRPTMRNSCERRRGAISTEAPTCRKRTALRGLALLGLLVARHLAGTCVRVVTCGILLGDEQRSHGDNERR